MSIKESGNKFSDNAMNYCDQLIENMKRQETAEVSHRIALGTEVHSEIVWALLAKKYKDYPEKLDAWKKVIKEYIEHPHVFNKDARENIDQEAKGRVERFDDFLREVQNVYLDGLKSQQKTTSTGRDNLQITYSAWNYPKSKEIGSLGLGFEIGIFNNDILTDMGYLDTYENRAHVKFEDKDTVKFVHIGYTGTHLGIPDDLYDDKNQLKTKPTTAYHLKNLQTGKSHFPDIETMLIVPNWLSKAGKKGLYAVGEARIQYPRLTKWKVHKIDNSGFRDDSSVYICLEQVHIQNTKYNPKKNSNPPSGLKNIRDGNEIPYGNWQLDPESKEYTVQGGVRENTPNTSDFTGMYWEGQNAAVPPYVKPPTQL